MRTPTIDESPALREKAQETARMRASLETVEARLEDVRQLRRNTADQAEAIVADPLKPTALETEERVLANNAALLRAALRQKQNEFDAEHYKFCSDQAQRFKPEHTTLVKAIALAIVRLSTLSDLEPQFRDSVRRRGIAFADTLLRPMPATFAGSLDDANSSAAQFLREAIDFGFLTKAEIESEVSRTKKEYQNER